MASQKKSFKTENPALQFLSTESEETENQGNQELAPSRAELETQAPEGHKINPAYIETKSKRIQSLIQPSVYEAIKALAKEKGTSVNELVNEALREYIVRSK